VVVFNLTRFARDKYDHFALLSHLQSLGISLRSATEPIDDTSTGKLMEGVLAAFAQFDAIDQAERPALSPCSPYVPEMPPCKCTTRP
jgi:DNA invertase Pin-like site-specific DNA recombinase